MTTESINNQIVIRSPLDVVASVPYLLGFQPGESIVAVFFGDTPSYNVVARIDLKQRPSGQRYPVRGFESLDDYLASGIDRCVRSAIESGANSAQLIAYLPEPPHVILEYLQTVADLINQAGLSIYAQGWVDQGLWFDADKWFTPSAHDNPGEAISDASRTQCSWVAQGASYLPNRDSLWDLIRGTPTQLAEDVLAGHRAGNHDWYQYAGSWRIRRKIENQLFAYITAAVVDQLQRDEYATWMLALWDRRVREPLLWRLAAYLFEGDLQPAEARRAMDRLCFLVRNSPASFIAPVASVAATFAWQIGEGPLASTIAEHGLNDDSANVMCGLVWQAVNQGLHPGGWTASLQAMTLRQLRGTQSKIRSA